MSHKSPAAAQGQDKLGDTHTTYYEASQDGISWKDHCLILTDSYIYVLDAIASPNSYTCQWVGHS